jgi:signal peptidase I
MDAIYRKWPVPFELSTKLLYFGLSANTPKTVDLKPLFIPALLSGFLVGLWLIGKATFALRLIRVKSPSGQPAIPRNKIFLTSNLKRPKRLRLICYRGSSPNGPVLKTHRLCGLPGDVVEIRAGILYVNGSDADRDLGLMHIFKVNRSDSGQVQHDPRMAYTIPPYSDILYIPLADSYVRDNRLPCERYLLPPGLRDRAIFSVYKSNWNRDHFGPIKVPADRWFVLDDDRSNASDSRYLGFIDSSAYAGSVLWK